MPDPRAKPDTLDDGWDDEPAPPRSNAQSGISSRSEPSRTRVSTPTKPTGGASTARAPATRFDSLIARLEEEEREASAGSRIELRERAEALRAKAMKADLGRELLRAEIREANLASVLKMALAVVGTGLTGTGVFFMTRLGHDDAVKLMAVGMAALTAAATGRRSKEDGK
jgi:hypothetical protein